MPTSRLFDFAFEFLELFEHFDILPHRVDPSVPRVAFNEEHVISVYAECGRLSRFLYIEMNYAE